MITRTRLMNSAALANYGCRIIGTSPELQSLIQHLLGHASIFFRTSPLTLKLLYETTVGEGYRAFGSEYTDSKDQADLVESFSCSRPRSEVKASFPTGPGLALYEILLKAHSSFALLADVISRDLLRTIGVELPSGLHFNFPAWSRLQINYGVPERAHRELLNVRHEDGNFLTITFSTAPGLELVTDKHTLDLWSPNDSDLVALAGEILSSVTDGRVNPGYHQVRRRPEANERLALIYFADASPSSLVQLNASRSQQYYFDRITEEWLRWGVPAVQLRYDEHSEGGDR